MWPANKHDQFRSVLSWNTPGVQQLCPLPGLLIQAIDWKSSGLGHAGRGAQRVLVKVIGGNKQPSADCRNSEF
jgi:hypothetical protein